LLLAQRTGLIAEMESLPMVEKVYPTDANFVLVRVNDANATYRYLVDQSIIVRNRNNISLCLGCLRITVGTAEENNLLIEALKQMK